MIKDLKISMFKGPIQNVIDPKEITVEQMINLMIKPPKILKDQIEKIKLIIDKTLRDKEKGKLPYYTVTGLFDIFREDQIVDKIKEQKYVGHKRRKGNCFIPESYTYIIPIDVDKSENNDFDVDEVFKKIKGIPGIFFIIKSPSGKGIKALLIVKNNYPSETHRRVCKELIYPSIEKHIGCKLDEAQATLTQALYYTTGEYYLDWNIEPLEVDINNLKEQEQYEPLSPGDYDEQFYHIPDKLYEHYSSSIPIMSAYKKSSPEIRREYYFKFKKLYKGSSIPLDSFDLFDNFINQKSFDIIPNFIKNENVIEIIDENKKIINLTKKLHSLSTYDALKWTTSLFDPTIDYKEEEYIYYPIFKEKKLCAIYGSTGEGKSIMAMKIANEISIGKTNNYPEKQLFKVYTPPQNVCYIDYELGASSIKSRYIRNGKSPFSENLKIINVNNLPFDMNTNTGKNQEEKNIKVVDFIMSNLKYYNSKIAFIDNLSNIADKVEVASDADQFIRHLYARMKSENVTLIFVAHTPKVDRTEPLSINKFKGSSSLAKTFENIVGFKRSKDNDISYLKQIKYRDVDYRLDDDNVAMFSFTDDDGFNLKYEGLSPECDLLPEKTKKNFDEINETDLNICFSIFHENLSYRKIMEKYNFKSKSKIVNIKWRFTNDENFREKYYSFYKSKTGVDFLLKKDDIF